MFHRALGDFAFKHPQALISAEPDVHVELLCPDDVMVLLLSDGVTDVLTDQQIWEIGQTVMNKVRVMPCQGHLEGCASYMSKQCC